MNKTDHMGKRVFISADHGLAIVYFLQSDVASTLIEAGVEVVLLTDDVLKEKIEERFGRKGLTVEGLRFQAAQAYERKYKPSAQFWVGFLRRSGFWASEINHYTNKIKMNVIFPKSRPPLQAYMIEKNRQRTISHSF